MFHKPHHPHQPCRECEEWSPQWLDVVLRLEDLATQIERGFTAMTENQTHLDADVAALTTAFATVVEELKAQPGAAALDFTAADALVASVQGEAAADAPPAAAPAPDAPPAV